MMELSVKKFNFKKLVLLAMCVVMALSVMVMSASAAINPAILPCAADVTVWQSGSNGTVESMADDAIDGTGTAYAEQDGSNVKITVPIVPIEYGGYMGYITGMTIGISGSSVSVTEEPQYDNANMIITAPLTGVTSGVLYDVAFTVELWQYDEEAGAHEYVTTIPPVAQMEFTIPY